jgi:hypothetical protein
MWDSVLSNMAEQMSTTVDLELIGLERLLILNNWLYRNIDSQRLPFFVLILLATSFPFFLEKVVPLLDIEQLLPLQLLYPTLLRIWVSKTGTMTVFAMLVECAQRIRYLSRPPKLSRRKASRKPKNCLKSSIMASPLSTFSINSKDAALLRFSCARRAP